MSTKVIPGVSDHMAILCWLSLPIYSDHVVERECYFYDQVVWKDSNAYFSNIDWSSMLNVDDVSITMEYFIGFVLKRAQKCCENVNAMVQ